MKVEACIVGGVVAKHVTDTAFAKYANALAPILVNPVPKVIFKMDVQLLKASCSIVCKPFGKTKDFKPPHE